VAEMLRDVDVRAVHTSPSQRCRETAAHLHAPAPVVEPGLDECDYGEWSGRELKDLAGEPLWATIQSRPSTVTFPAGESMAALSGRAVAAARSVVTGHDGGVVVAVSHG